MHIFINNIKWNIKYVSEYDNNLFRNDGTLTVGMTDNKTKTIYLNENLESELLTKVLTHELCHAFIFSYNIYLTLPEEEFVCEFVSNFCKNILICSDYILYGH